MSLKVEDSAAYTCTTDVVNVVDVYYFDHEDDTSCPHQVFILGFHFLELFFEFKEKLIWSLDVQKN